MSRLLLFLSILLPLLSSVCTIEDCFNGTDDDGDGMIDLNDSDCSCSTFANPIGSELIFNGGFEAVANNVDCQGCISLFDSDNCPLGWLQESVNLHTMCFTSMNPAQNIGYVSANSNYQGVGGFGTNANNERQQQEFLQTTLLNPLIAGMTYRFSGNFEIPSASIPGINLSTSHQLVLMGSQSTDLPINSSGNGCYEDRANWELLARLEIINNDQDVFNNYSVTFIAPGPVEEIAIASSCCQHVDLPEDESLTYYAVDNISLTLAESEPLDNEISLSSLDCSTEIFLCVNTEAGAQYQWFREGIAINNQTGPCLTQSANITDGTIFQCWIKTADNCIILEKIINRGCDFTAEDCANGIDDDGDGWIDVNDPDCDCSGPRPEISIQENYCPTPEFLLTTSFTQGHPLQWFFNGVAIPGATQDSLLLVDSGALIGNYQLRINYPDSSCGISTAISPTPPPVLLFSATSEVARCFGDSSGNISLEPIIETTENYNFSWRAEDGSEISSQQQLLNIPGGRYFLSVNHSSGCSVHYTYLIDEPDPIQVLSFTDYNICGTTTPGGTLRLSFSTPSDNFQHCYFANQDNSCTPFSEDEIFLENGIYTGESTDENGCKSTWGPINIAGPSIPNFNISSTRTIINLGDSTAISVENISPELEFNQWLPTSTFSCHSCPSTFIRPFESTIIFATATNRTNGCVYADSLELFVDKSRHIYFPNVFSPNNDGINDRWKIFPGPAVSEIVQLSIYDRWGGLIYVADGTNEWSGNKNNETPVASGIYVYKAVIQFIDKRQIIYSGELLLLK